jgi:tetratricopeptide (TPR) repeat protein
LLAAQGWAELGDFAEADAELKQITSTLRAHPQVLEVRYGIYALSERWDLAAEMAGMLVGALGGQAGAWISLAYAVRRKTGGGIPEAREILTKALSLFPSEAIIVYNLACYDCQLGLEITAMEWLKLAIALDNKKGIKTMALKDTDLKPIWNEIERL